MEINSDVVQVAPLQSENESPHGEASPDIAACSILIIDDEVIICNLIDAYLRYEGYTHIRVAHNGRSGLELIASNEPDIVILDVDMPEMNGVDVLKSIRRQAKYDDLPIIIETAGDAKKSRDELLRAGATNIISKPIDFEILSLRIKSHLEHRILVRSLKAYQQRVQQELDAARTMQSQLLPRTEDIKAIEIAYELQVDWHYRPSSELGGDWWGIKALDSYRFAVYAVDFSGHGVGAALNTFRLSALMKDVHLIPEKPSDYLSILNDMLTELIPLGQFATMNFAIIDVDANTLTYSSAGYTPPIIGNTSSGNVIVGEARGRPLGIEKSASYTDHEYPFHPGDFLFLYSDALIESPGKDGLPEIKGDGLERWVCEMKSQSGTKQPMQLLLDKFYSYTEFPPRDDVTAIWIGRKS